ncbi:MAG TPA: P1 family peptidase [Thermomicrobiales bacterium]|nr:P1 family peptidase [Thermomicrobiales bacterium]
MSQNPTRARDLGIVPGRFEPGPLNAMTDVPGVRVGQTTLIDAPDIHTGVTAIVPDQLMALRTLPANLFVGNGYGKLIGSTQLVELGEIETPILLTGTLSAFRVADALVSYMLSLPGNEEMTSVNPIVGETNDGFLSDIRSRPISEAHVLAAISAAATGPVAEGCVGAGTGTTALGFKAGIGTSSRVVEIEGRDALATIGVLVQANFGGTLQVTGTSIPADEAIRWSGERHETNEAEQGNSCMIVVATDAPLDARQLGRVATRAVFGMARVGADYTHGSGDYGIAFSVGEGPVLRDAELNPIFIATQEAVEEALLNSLFMATTTIGYRKRVRHAVPHAFVLDQLARRA